MSMQCFPGPRSTTVDEVISAAVEKLQKDMTVGELADLLAKLPRDRPVIVRQNDGTETSLRMALCAHDNSTDTFDSVLRLFVGGPLGSTEPRYDEAAQRQREADEFSAYLRGRRRALAAYRESKTLEDRVAYLEELHQDKLTSW